METEPTRSPRTSAIEHLDTAALALLVYDVALLEDGELDRPTPCTGWTVIDLLHHMNQRHAAITDPVFGPGDALVGDPRQRFALGAARWTQALAPGRESYRVPGLAGPVPRAQVQAVHFVDMLTHRWDLSKALGRPGDADDLLTDAAMSIAESVTAPGSPLVGTAYQPSRATDGVESSLDRLAALLGRDPAWSPPPMA